MMNNKIKPQTLLSTLWIFVLLNIIFRDLHQMIKVGYMEEILNGTVNGITITDELMLLGGFLAEVPILMVPLSRILGNRANKWANIIAGLITIAVFVTGIPTLDIDDAFHMIIEVVAILWIFRIAWKLPINNTETNA